MWDSESEVSKDCTMMESRYDVEDADGSESQPKKKSRKTRKRSRSPSSATESISEDCQ